MTSPSLFLSHSGPDKATAIDLKRRLLSNPDAQAAGLKVWLDVDDLDEGKPWQPQLEAAMNAATAFSVIVGTNGIRNWVRAETDLALSRAIGDESFRIIPILQDGGSEHLTPFVKRYHAVRDPLNDPDALQRLLRAALGLDKNGLPVLTEAPFPGLRSMSEDWADRFFGRRSETDEVLAMLRRHRAVTIVADSGAGKSSLAMAGVGHAWRGGALRTDRPRVDDRAIWHVVTMRPAENPIEQLRDAIEVAAKQLGNDQAAISTYREKLTTDPAFAIRCGLAPAATTTLLIIDQAEELVTLTSRDRRPEFGRLITALADAMGERLRILITLRSEHLNLVSGVEWLGAMVRPPEAQFNLKQPVDLAEIVRGPLTLAGHRDEEEQKNLIGLLRNDLSDRPSHLALAQMTLSLAWRDRGKLGGLLGAYAANGGARAALGNEAERIEGILSQEDTARLMPIFIRLIRLSEIDTGATRRIAARDEFDDYENRLIDQLAGEEYGRLVQTSAAHVEIAHEALITQWPRLHHYLVEHAGDLRTLSDLMRRAQDWVAAGESAKHLTSLADEERFHALRLAQVAWLAPVERRFMDWSQAEHQSVRDKQDAEALAKAEALKGRERAVLRGLTVVGMLLFILLWVAWFALERDKIAQTQSKLANKSRVDAIALLALSKAQSDPIASIKLALASWPLRELEQFPPLLVIKNALEEALQKTSPHRLLQEDSKLRSIAFSHDSRFLVAGDSNGIIYLWEIEAEPALKFSRLAHAGPVNDVAFSLSDNSFFSVGEDGVMNAWKTDDGHQIYSTNGFPDEGPINSIHILESQKSAIMSGNEGSIIVRSTAHKFEVLHQFNFEAALSETGSPDEAVIGEIKPLWAENQFVAICGIFTLCVFDTESAKITVRTDVVGNGAEISSFVVSKGYKSFLVSGDSNLASRSTIFDDDYIAGVSLQKWVAWPAYVGSRPNIATSQSTSLALSKDEAYLFVGSSDGILTAIDMNSGLIFGKEVFTHHGRIDLIALSESGELVATFGDDGNLRIWKTNELKGEDFNRPVDSSFRSLLVFACENLPEVDGSLDTSTDGLAAEIGIEGLTLPEDCDTYDPPLPPAFLQ